MGGDLRLREARADECVELGALAMRSKAHWGYSPAFMHACTDALQLSAADLRGMTVRVAESHEGQLLGFSAIEPLASDRPLQEAEVARLFVEPQHMGRGVGRALLEDLRLQAATEGVDVLWILSDPQAEPFYLHLGAVRAGMRPSDAIPGRMLPWLRLATGRATSILTTPRLKLRPLTTTDRPSLAAINGDARVMRYLGARVLTRDESDALADVVEARWRQQGFGVWGVERTDIVSPAFIGILGLHVPRFRAHFTPCVELLWRLSAAHWGAGLATEGAVAAAKHAHQVLGLEDLVAFTAINNSASRRVMTKLGMTHDAGDDFDHPSLSADDPLRRHVLYRLPNPTR